MITFFRVDPGLDETTVTFRMSGTFAEQAVHLADVLLAVNGEGVIDTTGVGVVLADLAQDEINRRLS